MEKFIVDNEYSYSELPIEKKSFYEDEEVLNYIHSIENCGSVTEREILELLLNPNNKKIEDKFIRAYLYLPVRIASKFTILNASLTNMDLIEYGNIGLVNAIKEYKFDDGNLEKYLIKKIKKSILDACQKNAKMFNLSASESSEVIKINKLHEDILKDQGYDFSGWNLFYEWDMLDEDGYPFKPVSLEKERKEKFDVYSRARHSIISLDTIDKENELGEDLSIDLEHEALTSILHDIFEEAFQSGKLSEIEVYILKSYFGFIKEKTTSELACELGISVRKIQMHRSKAFNKVRNLTISKLVTYKDNYVKTH